MAAAVYTSDGLWVGASGLADRDKNVAMSPCHAFFSGSVAKTYTVAAAMSLVDRGILDLDAPIADHLSPDLVQGLPNASDATVRQLMNHTAGMPDHDDDEALEAYVTSHDGALPSAEDQLRYLFDDAARFPAGTSAQYSSAHTLALSLVVDDASGRHHSHQITGAILRPLALKQTWYKNEPGYPRPMNLVRGYIHEDGETADYTEESINYARTSHGDAGVIATVDDYYGFLRGLMEGRVVSERALAAMSEAYPLFNQSGHGMGFGLGLFVIERNGKVAKVGHSGATLGGMTHLYYYPESGAYIALATNVLTGDETALGRWGAGLLLDEGTRSVMSDLEAVVR